jgi:hypothetical protein
LKKQPPRFRRWRANKLPNVRDQAAADIQKIIEDESGAGTPYILIDDKGEYPVVGTLGDIGTLTDPITGEAIQDRSIEATVSAQTITAAAGKVPARGWRACVTGLDGKTITLHVQQNAYDRTIGLCLLTLGLHLPEKEK